MVRLPHTLHGILYNLQVFSWSGQGLMSTKFISATKRLPPPAQPWLTSNSVHEVQGSLNYEVSFMNSEFRGHVITHRRRFLGEKQNQPSA